MRCLACERHILYRIIIRLPEKNITPDKHLFVNRNHHIHRIDVVYEALTQKTKNNNFKISYCSEYEEDTVIIQIILDAHVAYNKNKKIYNENIKKITHTILEYTKTEFKDLLEGFIEEYTTNNIIPLIKNE